MGKIGKHLANLFEVAALLSITTVVVGYLGKWHFLFDLSSHFRIQATFTLLVTGLGLHWMQRQRWATISMISGILLTVTLFPYLFPTFSDSTGPGPRTFRFLTMNVFTDNPQKVQLAQTILDANPDVIVLMETDAKWLGALERTLRKRWPYGKAVARSDNFGIAVLSKFRIRTSDVIEFDSIYPMPSIAADIQLPDGGTIRLIATHPMPPMNRLCWQSRNSHFKNLANDVASRDASRTIVTGDLNSTPWSPWFGQLLRDSGLTNSMNKKGLGISWTPVRFQLLGLPIDHFLVGDEIAVCDRFLGDSAGSDHHAVILDWRFVDRSDGNAP